MGGGRSTKKRKRQHGFDDEESKPAVNPEAGATVAQLKIQEAAPRPDASQSNEPADSEWQTVQSKKQKKQNYPELGYSVLHRLKSCIKISDLQSIVLYCLADGTAPQWLSVRHHAMVRRAVVLLVPGLEKEFFHDAALLRDADSGVTHEPLDGLNGQSDHDASSPAYVKNNVQTNRLSPQSPDDFLPFKLDASHLHESVQPLAHAFPYLWPVKAPGDERLNKVHSPLQAMLQSPLPKNQEDKQEKSWKGPKPPKEAKAWVNKRTPITQFLLGAEDMVENEYVLHPVHWKEASLDPEAEIDRRRSARQSAADGWVDSRVPSVEAAEASTAHAEKGSVTAGRQVLALDCEMCKIQGGSSALTRVTIINWAGETVLDELVKPTEPIIDYLTPYSGITADMLAPITTTLSDIQHRLLSIFTPITILIGHSLNFDLAALKATHPFIIDTSVLYPHPRGPPMRSSLKWLSQKYLAREIQKGQGSTGHDSIEDALATLDLVKLKCERGPQWGTQEATVEPIFRRLKRSSNPSSHARTGAIIDHGAPERNFGQMADFCVPCTSDDDVVAGVQRAVLGDPDGSYIPGGGVDFTWARLRDLESLRGWSNHNTSTPNKQPAPEPSSAQLREAVSRTTSQIMQIHSSLPACTLFVVYTGTGDPRAMSALQDRQRKFKQEFRGGKKWEDIREKWTDREEGALREAVRRAREGWGCCVSSSGFYLMSFGK